MVKSKEIGSMNVVILAKSHNPTIVSKEWLIRNEILEEPIVNFIHTPPFSMVESNDLRIHVDSDRMQMIVKKVEPNIIDKLPSVIRHYVTSLPETPYTAIGFNFSYREITEKNFGNIFSPDVEKFRKAFSEDYRVGGIIQFNFDKFIVTLNLRPEDKGIASFNFHSDVKGGSSEIIEKLNSYHEIMRKAEGVLEVLFDG
jgi:hypothetical protein